MLRRGSSRVVAVVVLVAATAAIAIGGAGAALHNPQPANASGDPTYEFAANDSLWAYATADVLGGYICVVPATGDLSQLSCAKPAKDMGTATRIAAYVGTAFTLVKNAPLVEGSYRLLVEDENHTPLETSQPFTVAGCNGGCDTTPDAGIVAAFKSAAQDMELRMGGMCALQGVLEKVAGKAIDMRGIDKTIQVPKIPEQLQPVMPDFVLQWSGQSWEVQDPATAGIQKALDLYKQVSCGAREMYHDMAADPPDPNYMQVAPPDPNDIATLTPASLDAVTRATDWQRAYVEAARIAFERYQGAAAANDVGWEITQLHAAADNAWNLALELGATTAALDGWASDAAAEPNLAGPMLPAANEPGLAAAYARVRDTGFTFDEIAQFHAYGYTDDDIAAIRTHADVDVSSIPLDTSYADALTAVALHMEDGAQAIADFASEADSVASQLEASMPVNHDPIAAADSLSVVPGGSGTVDVLANDSDPDGDTLAVTGSANGSNGAVSCTPGGACTYTPATGYVGSDSFTYTISDGRGGTATGTVSVTVAANQPPAAADDALTVVQGGVGTVNVLANDSDPDGDALSVTGSSDGAHGTVSCNAAGLCAYTAAGDYTGADSFDYTISDGRGGTATATVAVTVTATPPEAWPDSTLTDVNTPVTLNVLANDTDPNLAQLAVDAATSGTTHGSATCTPDGLCTYTPDQDYVGPDRFRYRVTDALGAEAFGNACVIVGAHGLNGYAASAFATGFAGCGGDANPVGVAFDPSGNFFVSSYVDAWIYELGPHGGTVSRARRLPVQSSVDHGLVFDRNGRMYGVRGGGVYQLDPSTGDVIRQVSNVGSLGLAIDPLSGDLFVAGFLNVIYRISNFADGMGTATVYANVAADGIAFGPDGTLYAAEYPIGIVRIAGTDKPNAGEASPLLAQIPDADGIAVAASADPTKPPFLLVNTNDGRIVKVDLTTDPATTTDVYENGTRGDFVTVGPDGCLYATQSEMVVELTNADGSCSLVPTTPVATLSLAPLAASPHVGETQTLTATLANVTNPAGTGVTFTVTGANPQSVTVQAGADGRAAFTYGGKSAGVDTVVASAAGLTSSAATVTWLAAANHAPVAYDGTLTTDEGVAADTTLAATDADGDPLTYAIVDGPSHGTLSGSGRTRTYTPAAGFHGSDSFTFEASDGKADSNVATIDITVAHVLHATSTTYSGARTVQYSDPVTLTAGLVDTSVTPNAGVAGKQIDFTVGVQSASAAPTATDGTASTSLVVTQRPGSVANVGASFAGDGDFLASSDAASFTIAKEDCTLSYSGDVDVAPLATTTLSADLGETDASLGDRSGKTVVFTLVGSAGAPQTVAATTDGTGHASVLVPLLADVYAVSVAFEGDDFYTACSTPQDALVTVESAAAKVTGGGWTSAGTGRTDFGFNAIPQAGGVWTGQFQLHSNSDKNRFHGRDVTSFRSSGNSATWSGTGSWNGATGYTFTVSVVDNGSAGSKKADAVSIVVTAPGGATVFTTSGLQTLKGGNITVHT